MKIAQIKLTEEEYNQLSDVIYLAISKLKIDIEFTTKHGNKDYLFSIKNDLNLLLKIKEKLSNTTLSEV